MSIVHDLETMERPTPDNWERWRRHPRYPAFQVSDRGRVIRLWQNGKRSRMLKPMTTPDGYHRISVRVGGRRKKVFLHHFVAETWVGLRPSSSHQIRHLNGARTDNNATNLLWGTIHENMADRDAHGNTQRGEAHYRAKLRAVDVLEIRRRVANTSKAELAREFGVSGPLVSYIVLRRIWKHV